MEQWLDPTQEMTALALSLCASFAVYLRSIHPIPGFVVVALMLLIGSSFLPSEANLILASSLVATWALTRQVSKTWGVATLAMTTLAMTTLAMTTIAMATRRKRLPSWLSVSSGSSEIAVQVTAHPVSSKLQVFHLSRWFDAILIDPANPPLRVGESVYLIRHSGRQAWVSRVRSHTPPDDSRQWRRTSPLSASYCC